MTTDVATATMQLPSSSIPGVRTAELNEQSQPPLQRFYEDNPEYFIAVEGEPAGPNAAHETIQARPPPGWGFAKKWLIGYFDAAGSMIAVADVVTDLLAPGVWHIGLFILATERHGSGEAQMMMRGLESWAISNGAKWLRLSVVKGNARAERFWESLGFQDARTREGVEMGKRRNSMRIMFKPLAGGSRDQYFSLVDRDRPEAE
jgi:ribosomal protein S18 acetylase RimI-like enzyme